MEGRAMTRFGATGRYPMGHAAPHDEGELQLGIAADSGRVLINFGKPVHSLGLDADQAEVLASVLMSHATKARAQADALALLPDQ